MQIIVSNNVNPIFLRPVLGIVPAIDSVLLWKWGHLCHSYSLVLKLFHSGGSCRVGETTQECASDTESVTLIINCFSLLFCDLGRPGRVQFFYKQEAEDMEKPWNLGIGEAAEFCSSQALTSDRIRFACCSTSDILHKLLKLSKPQFSYL